jgi:hypothetical protein
MERANRNTWKKIGLFFIVANLPFLTMVHLMGNDMFLASFQHPEMYQYIKVQKGNNLTLPEGYLILEKPSTEELLIHNGDTILYKTGEGAVRCEPVISVELSQGTKVYYTTTPPQDDVKEPIYDTQIIGKVTGAIEDNLWNALCLRLWDFSIKNLNAYHLF